MKKKLFLSFFIIFIQGCGVLLAKPNYQGFRAPAYPLITSDPYLSIWSFRDTLYKGPTRHWTGKVRSLQGIIRVDGHSMYFMGKPIPNYNTILPLSSNDNGTWRYRFNEPNSKNWNHLNYNDSGWQKTRGAFSTGNNAPNKWNTHDIWVRRPFYLKKSEVHHLLLNLHHDDNVWVYINGVLAYHKNGWVNSPVLLKMDSPVKKVLRKGRNILAIHCENTAGGAYLDAGIVEKLIPKIRLPHAQQISVRVRATQTIYHFRCDDVGLQLTFTTPKLPQSLDLISRPASYVTFQVHSLDGRSHKVQLYFSVAGNLAVNTNNENIVWNRVHDVRLSIMRVGTKSQHILGLKGDRVGINWGYLYVASPREHGESSLIAASQQSIRNFVTHGRLTLRDDHHMPRPAGRNPVTLATAFNVGSIGAMPVKRHVMVAYDERYPIEYFHHKLKAWWKRNPGMTAKKMLDEANMQYAHLMRACDAFDAHMVKEATKAGGIKYARLCELAYRQALAACKLAAGPHGKPLYFCKENSSDGDISTVDVMFPTSPILLYYNPTLLKGLMDPIFHYSTNGMWTQPYAPHDLGFYPIANGKFPQEKMPIEESGNMLIMTAAIAEVEGNASYAREHWKILTKWTKFLLKNGMDPKNQLSTDDFAGKTTHNANLSIKAIVGLACYGKLAGMLGHKKLERTYIDTARWMAQKWIRLDQEGNHFKLTFDRSHTWSQLYNQVWDKVLHLNIFPKWVARKEIAFYLTKLNKYGLPLDSRHTYTKSDWTTWTATMAQKKGTFEQFIDRLYAYVTHTPSRVPMSDWYQTTNAKQMGFQARSVVGAYFIKMLDAKLNK